MPTAAEAPPAPAATPPAVDTGIAHGAPSTGARPSTFRPPNPAFDRVAAKIKAKAGVVEPEKPTAPPPKPPEQAEIPKQVEQPKTDETPKVEPDETNTTETQPKEGESAEPKKEKKVSPWRLVDEWKKTASDYKSKLESLTKENETLKSGKPTELPAEVTERISGLEAKVKRYEDHLRFLDYQQHPEFQEKYAKPYEAAWQLATSELSEISVTDPASGATRPATGEDMLALVNLPLGRAREYADQIFGAFADDAMAHRKAIKTAFDAQKAALQKAKEEGASRIQQAQQQTQAQAKARSEFVSKTWEAENRAQVTGEYGKFFTPVEGDQKGNAALAKGIEFVDKAFSANPNDPNLSEEDRTKVIRRHAKMRQAAAAFPRMVQWLEERDAKIKELEERLDQYAESEPSTGGGTGAKTKPEAKPADPFERIKAALIKRSGH